MNKNNETTGLDLTVPARLLTRSEAAQYLRRSTGTLANWAAKRKGPVYYRQEDGAVVYAVEDLAEWLALQRVLPVVA
ncbi:helix-turn-helix domain-containing protein [Pseudarthrobacter sp. NIBRBAC000502770]|uniref:helix-turn-helix domain-containing protein n=1 Tax=Pseudarthrobacter sp. NIBRBAC000502770 TaxID=2590785 RepID=UPI001140887E|nr:helix-turn-helix domain-containing protein [Pseudarthrobacter sp. NIBRBAC000502770]QDG89032.1 helix-turn-helix domain-containing protein [Pseudarthrobacter sp. NIBRBAC000502770]